MIDRIAQVSIPAVDVERAAAFYRDVVGLRFLFEAPPDLVFFDCGGIRVLVGRGEPAAPHSGTLLYFHTGDIGATVARLRDGGAEIEREPQRIAQLQDRDVWLALFRDTEGNVIELMSEVLHEGVSHA